jgi:cytochrome c biogenesis protein CcmG, thiol:disulfide interchange protein DsbE
VRRHRLLIGSVVVTLAALGTVALAGVILEDGNGAASPTSASGTVEVNPRAPAIVGQDPVTGATVALARVKRKPVALAVWASWCVPCARQAPILRRFARDHRREAVVLGLDLQDKPVDARAFYERFRWAFRSIADPEGRFTARLAVEELPTTLFLDRDRLIVARIPGIATRADLERGLAEAKRTRS